MHTYLAILLLSILSISVPVKAVAIESGITRWQNAQIVDLESSQTKERGSGRIDDRTSTKERGSGRIAPQPNDSATKMQSVVELGQKQCERGSGRCNAEV